MSTKERVTSVSYKCQTQSQSRGELYCHLMQCNDQNKYAMSISSISSIKHRVNVFNSLTL